MPDWPESLPPFILKRPEVLLSAVPDGSIVVKRTPRGEETGLRYDVIDRNGELKAVLRLPDSVRLLGFGRTSVYTISTNELGLQTLRRNPWTLR